mmetsp:Transcript_102135/g.284387  ORF Transcript_102135/g.284387 Transcript_102135/m.284387 type:complete len:93 (+) Transcript_102135:239-517(+)
MLAPHARCDHMRGVIVGKFGIRVGFHFNASGCAGDFTGRGAAEYRPPLELQQGDSRQLSARFGLTARWGAGGKILSGQARTRRMDWKAALGN